MMKRRVRVYCLAALVSAILVLPALAAPPKTDPAIPPYQPVSGISGNLNSIGSDTLNNLMTFWAEGFRKLYPNVNIQIEGKGSATAPPALTAGTAQLAPMSREMKPEEEDAFEKKHGYKPTRITVALDCLAVYVHKDNPIAALTLEQLDCIFSRTRKSGFADITTWGQVGLSGDWESLPISIYGRNSASGTYAYFKEHVLLKGDYKDTVKEQPGSAAVVNGVANDRAGIGYSGIGYKTSEVRAIPLAKKAGATTGGADVRQRPGGQVSARPRAVHLRHQEAGPAAGPGGQGVPEVRALQGGPGDRDQGRLRPAAAEGHRQSSAQDAGRSECG